MLQAVNTTTCLRSTEGSDYHEFSCLYPALETTYTEFEKNYNPEPVHRWMESHPWVPVLAVCIYGIGITTGRKYFADKPRLNWKYTMAAWNLFLSTFSFIGMCRTLPHLIHNVTHLSVRDNMCSDGAVTHGLGSTGLWVQLFVLSKFPELLDTFFIVIHKKPLIFLHWYHHVTVLLYCWHSYVMRSPTGLFFVTMNYAVHSSMYGYYFMVVMKCKPKWIDPMFITVSQIAQMFLGVAVTLTGFYFFKASEKSGETCHISKENNMAAFGMYGSYLFLFMQFFFSRYSVKPSTSAKQKSL